MKRQKYKIKSYQVERKFFEDETYRVFEVLHCENETAFLLWILKEKMPHFNESVIEYQDNIHELQMDIIDFGDNDAFQFFVTKPMQLRSFLQILSEKKINYEFFTEILFKISGFILQRFEREKIETYIRIDTIYIDGNSIYLLNVAENSLRNEHQVTLFDQQESLHEKEMEILNEFKQFFSHSFSLFYGLNPNKDNLQLDKYLSFDLTERYQKLNDLRLLHGFCEQLHQSANQLYQIMPFWKIQLNSSVRRIVFQTERNLNQNLQFNSVFFANIFQEILLEKCFRLSIPVHTVYDQELNENKESIFLKSLIYDIKNEKNQSRYDDYYDFIKQKIKNKHQIESSQIEDWSELLRLFSWLFLKDEIQDKSWIILRSHRLHEWTEFLEKFKIFFSIKKIRILTLSINEEHESHLNETELLHQFSEKESASQLYLYHETQVFIDKFERFRDLLIFLALLKKEIALNQLSGFFSNSQSIPKIIDKFYLQGIIYRSVNSGYVLMINDPRLIEQILSNSDRNSVLTMIRSMAVDPAIRPYFNEKIVLKFLRENNETELLTELLIKKAHYLRKHQLQITAKGVYLNCLASSYSHASNDIIFQQIHRIVFEIDFRNRQWAEAIIHHDLMQKNDELISDKLCLLEIETELAENPIHLHEKWDRLSLLPQNDEEKSYLALIKSKIYYKEFNIEQALKTLENIESNVQITNNLYSKIIEFKYILLRHSNESSNYRKSIMERYSHKLTKDFHLVLMIENYELNKNPNDLKELCKLTLQCGKFDLYIRFLNEWAMLLYDLNQLNEAIDKYLRILDYAVILEKKEVAAQINAVLANIYRDFGDLEKAIQFETQALAIFTELAQYDDISLSYANLALSYMFMYERQQAINYVQMAYEMMLIDDKPIHRNFISLTYAYILIKNNHFSEADKMLNSGLMHITKDEPDDYLTYIFYKSLNLIAQNKIFEAKQDVMYSYSHPLIGLRKKYQISFLFLIAKIAFASANIKEADQLFEECLLLAEKANYNYWTVLIICERLRCLKEVSYQHYQSFLNEAQPKLKHFLSQFDNQIYKINLMESELFKDLNLDSYER